MIPAAVHTIGVNWESVATITGTIAVIVGGFTGFMLHRIDSSTKTVAYYLGLRLDRIERDADASDGEIHNLGERVARIEGPRPRRAQR